jgi:hypothetical protein
MTTGLTYEQEPKPAAEALRAFRRLRHDERLGWVTRFIERAIGEGEITEGVE